MTAIGLGMLRGLSIYGMIMAAALAGGCAQLCGLGAGRNQATNTPPQHDDPVFVQQKGYTWTAQSVNIFGEINGARQRTGSPVSEIGFTQHTFTDEGYDSDVSIDPTGRWLAFSSTRHNEHPTI